MAAGRHDSYQTFATSRSIQTYSRQPAIRGRRVPVSLVAELATQIGGDEILREDYDLSPEEIADAVRWWRATSAYEQVAA